MENRGATEWTIGKLMAIVLAVILLALIIYGISTGGINPLVEKIKTMGQNVMARFGFGDGADAGDCVYKKNILVYEIDETEKVFGDMTMCSDECKVDLKEGRGSYRFNFKTGHLEKYERLYVVEISRGFFGNVGDVFTMQSLDKKAYFKFNGIIEKWEWYHYWESKSWVSIPIPKYAKRPHKIINNEVVEQLIDKNLEEGISFFENKKSEVSGDKSRDISVENQWIDIEEAVDSSVLEEDKNFPTKIKDWLWNNCK